MENASQQETLSKWQVNSLHRVVEIGHIVAGPTAGLIFADMGYDVIKVERPGEGDISRRLSDTSSGAFPFFNRNKRSITLDFKDDKHREVFRKLISTSDILIDNLGWGAMKKLGLGYEELSRINPGLVYLSIKGYGEGPNETRKSLDFPIEIHSGVAYMTGTMDRPMRVGGSLIDMGAAMFGVIKTQEALIERTISGKGKYIDIGLFETAEFFMGQHIVTYQLNGKELKPLNEEGFAWAIYDFFPTKDGKKVFIGVTTDTQWEVFCRAMNLEVCSEKNLKKNEDRFRERKKLNELITNKTMALTEEELLNLLKSINMPYSTLKKPWELLYDPHAKPKMTRVNYMERELIMPQSPGGGMEMRDPPSLGQHNMEILTELGFNPEEIQEIMKGNK